MSGEERIAATEDAVKDLADRRGNKVFAHHEFPKNAYQDVLASLDSIKIDVSSSFLQNLQISGCYSNC